MNGTDRLFGVCKGGPFHYRKMSSLFREVEVYQKGRYVWKRNHWEWKEGK